MGYSRLCKKQSRSHLGASLITRYDKELDTRAAKIQWAIEGDEILSSFKESSIVNVTEFGQIKGCYGGCVRLGSTTPCRVKEEFRLHFANQFRAPVDTLVSKDVTFGFGLNGARGFVVVFIAGMASVPVNGEWSPSNLSGITNILHCFSLLSGLSINLKKSNLLGVGVRLYIEGTILSSLEDRWVWDLNGEGVFCVKDVRNLLDDVFLPKAPIATRWIKYVPIKLNGLRLEGLSPNVKDLLEVDVFFITWWSILGCFTGIMHCKKDDWRSLENKQCSFVMSPYEQLFADVMFARGTAGFVSVYLNEGCFGYESKGQRKLSKNGEHLLSLSKKE
ncbi:hypothetical protein Tco_1421049 [Tanacetum coccineum]